MGKLKIVSFSHISCGHSYWNCICDCGVKKKICGTSITQGKTVSCGCVGVIANLKHGLSRHPLYAIWASMRSRCGNPNNEAYVWYGAKGISVSSVWGEFKPFFEWAQKNGYKKGLTIDRVNSDLNYTPGNCRWISQSLNTRLANIKRWTEKGTKYTSKYKGVHWSSRNKKWYARVTIKGERVSCGYHKTEIEANLAIRNCIENGGKVICQ